MDFIYLGLWVVVCARGSLGHSSATTRRLGCVRIMANNPVWAICDRVAEVQALLHDHIECGNHSAADVVAKAQSVLSEAELLRAMFVAAEHVAE